MNIKKAFLPSAGLGTRLRPLTEKLPKGLVNVCGRPLITYALEHLESIGVEEVIISTHHAHHCWDEVFPDRRWENIKIHFSYEPVLLETGGGLKNTESFFQDVENFIVYNSDIVTNLPLLKACKLHLDSGKLSTLVLRTDGGFCQIALDQFKRVISVEGSQFQSQKTYLFTGIHILNIQCFKLIQKIERQSLLYYYKEWIKKISVNGLVLDDGHWQDLGTLEAIEKFTI
jgi:mannose-1-phosphate guanylyltransferase